MKLMVLLKQTRRMLAVRGCECGQVSVPIAGIMTLCIGGLVAVMFLLNFVPELETAIAGTTIENTFVLAMLSIIVWVLPVCAIGGLIFAGIKMFQRKNG